MATTSENTKKASLPVYKVRYVARLIYERTSRVIGAMGLLRISRSWNQTGDKWINEPDIEEWLNHPDNKQFLTSSSFLGAFGIFGWVRSTRNLSLFQEITVVVGLFGILAYRAALGSFSIPYPGSMCV